MRWTKTLAAAIGVLITWAPAWAQIQPGEYLDGSGGYLIVKPASGGSASFTLHTVGGNKHVCDAQGIIQKNRQAVLKEGGTTCTLFFEQKSDGVDVTLKDVCPAFCGARATLDGFYRRPESGCDRAGVKKARGEFKRQYDAKAFADARKTLEPVLDRCIRTLDSREEGWIRNDLALTHHRLGDNAACRRTLEPLVEDALKTEGKIREDLPPAEADSLVRISRAARTNLKLCAK